MIRLAFHIRESYKVDRRHVPPISEAIPGSGGNEQSYISTKERKWVLSEDLLNWQTCRGHSVSPTFNITCGVVGRMHDFPLVLAPVFPSISKRARLAIVPFLWLVCSRAFPAPPATPAACGRF